VLVRAFADGVAQAASKNGLVIAIDTAELAANAMTAIRDAIAQGGAEVVWLISGRFATPAASGYLTSTLGEFSRAIGGDRLSVIEISAFDAGLQHEYMRSRVPEREFDEALLNRVDLATGGIPLGLSLVADMLRDGAEPAVLAEVVDEGGNANLLIRGLATRFLHHALSVSSDGLSNLRDDLPAIFALVVDETAQAGRVIGYELQRRIQAAMLNVDPADLAARIDELAVRHDFVLAATGQVHREVAAVIREFMLGVDQRALSKGMHERALAVIGQELAERYSDVCVGDRAWNDQWRLLATAYVSHCFWLSTARGIAIVCELLPAAVILKPELTEALWRIAARHYPAASNDEQRILRGLPWGALVRFPHRLSHRSSHPPKGRGIPEPTAPDAMRACQVMAAERAPIAGLSNNRIARAIIGALLDDLLQFENRDLLGIELPGIEPVVRAHELLGGDDAALSMAVGYCTRSYAEGMMSGRVEPQDGLVAAEIFADRVPHDVWALGLHAVALERVGRMDDAERAYQRALAADPTDSTNLVNYAQFLVRVPGDQDRAEELFQRALVADPGRAVILRDYAIFLEHVRGEPERAAEHYLRALAIDPRLDKD